jgi:hypothetical protein
MGDGRREGWREGETRLGTRVRGPAEDIELGARTRENPGARPRARGEGREGKGGEGERELLKEFKDFSYLRCKCFVKNKKIKNLLHTRAPPLLPPFKLLKY